MALVNGPGSFYLMRFLLGVAEAGAYPGICYYLTAWYSEAQYGVAYSYIPTGSAFSGVIGGALAAVILQLDGVAGLPGWRWLFVVEGIIPVALGLALPRLLPLGPADAKFLAPADAAWLSKRQAREQQLRQTTSAAAEGRPWDAVRAAARNKSVWWCLAIWLTLTCSYYGILFFGPLIIQQVLNPNCRISDTGARDEHCPSKVDVRILLLSSVPYVAAIAAMTLNARHSRRTRERKLHMAVPMLFAIAGLVLTPLLGAYPALGFLAVIVATAGVWAVYGPMSELWGELDSGAAHAASFAIVNGGGNLGGLFGPLIIGSLTTSAGDFTAPFFLLAALMGVSAILVLAFPERRDARGLRGAASVASVDAEVVSEGAILLDTVADPADAT